MRCRRGVFHGVVVGGIWMALAGCDGSCDVTTGAACETGADCPAGQVCAFVPALSERRCVVLPEGGDVAAGPDVAGAAGDAPDLGTPGPGADLGDGASRVGEVGGDGGADLDGAGNAEPEA